MEIEKEPQNPLHKISANRRLVEELYSCGRISYEAKEYALNLLYPADKWGMWISRLLITIGSALLVCGIVYFFAFNWAKITSVVKFSIIQLGMIICLIGAYFCTLNRISGQLFLLSVSVLTGVFIAVFGQIYQTGADAYQLFMMWSIFTLGWTIISNFAPQWIFWLVVTNTFFILWWNQAALPTLEMEFMVFFFATLLNGAALALREYFASVKNFDWLQQKWSRVVLTLATLIYMMIPVIAWFVEPSRATTSIILSAMLGLIGHGIAFAIYRFKLRDMWSLSATVLSACIIVEVAGFKIISEMFCNFNATMFLFAGLMTLGIFTYAIIYLRKVAQVIGEKSV